MWATLICVGTFVGGVAATLVAQVVDGDARTTARNQFYIMLTTAITSGAALAAMIWNTVAASRREARQRQWQLEDDKRKDQKEREDREFHRNAAEDRRRMEVKLDDNTEVTKGGIKEAVNTAKVAAEKATAVDDKMADLRAHFDELKKQQP